ncbi:hypothetical protein ACFY1S_03475 [Micromonospora sp. NPDC000663]|uniref:hypothetical protein n=1 Tax=Micromonospora sp. NPDC000663 TaxID=3364218 RepID=UPI0036BEA0CE
MRESRLNSHHEVFQRYEDLAQMLAFRYGSGSQGIIFVLYDQLIALRRLLAQQPGSIVLRAWVAHLADRLRQRYEDEFPAAAMGHPTAVVRTDPVVVQYSRAAFEDKYRLVMDIVQPETIELTGPVLPAPVREGRPYMYVIDEDGRFLLWTRSFSFEELVFGRNKATVNDVPVGHPMLVPDRLRASAAGEVVFIGVPQVRAVVINNKSGHFRFPPSSREVIVDCCRRIFRLPGDAVDVFVVGGFESRLVERTLVLADEPETVTGKVEV